MTSLLMTNLCCGKSLQRLLFLLAYFSCLFMRKRRKNNMTKLDKRAFQDWKKMCGLRRAGFGLLEIAERMHRSVHYLISLENYFA